MKNARSSLAPRPYPGYHLPTSILYAAQSDIGTVALLDFSQSNRFHQYTDEYLFYSPADAPSKFYEMTFREYSVKRSDKKGEESWKAEYDCGGWRTTIRFTEQGAEFANFFANSTPVFWNSLPAKDISKLK